MKKLLLAALLVLARISAASAEETAYGTVPVCPIISTTVYTSVSNSAATVMFSSVTFGGVRVVTVQNLDGSANLWCNYGSCVTKTPTAACVGFRIPPYGAITFPMTPLQTTFAPGVRPQASNLIWCVNDSGAATNAVASLCR